MAGNAAAFHASHDIFLLRQCRDAVDEAKWYALYTCPRHEKMVLQQLNGKAVECYLPLYQSLRRWNDRKALIDLPLFPGYLFVRIPLSERLRVLTVPGVVRIVSFNGKPASLSDEEIQTLKASVGLHAAEPYPYMAAGKRVRIAGGPLKGLEGVVVRRKNKLRAVVSIHSIMQSYAVELDVADAQPAA
jgi:transcription antitermination factor NusG